MIAGFRVIFGSIILILSACSSLQLEKNCQNICQDQFMLCKKKCYRDPEHCYKAQVAQENFSYRHYEREQNIQGRSVALESKAFFNPLKCRKTTCDCVEDQRSCRQYCTGKIRKRLVILDQD